MKLKTNHWLKPGPNRDMDWSAIDQDTYDGAEDSSNRNEIGYGSTELEAIADLLRLKCEQWECEHPKECEEYA